MFRLWMREFADNHLIKDTVICDDSEDTRTHKIMNAIEKGCYEFDIGKPIWLDMNVKDFKKHGRCRFTQDNFVEEISFDYLDIRIIEE